MTSTHSWQTLMLNHCILSQSYQIITLLYVRCRSQMIHVMIIHTSLKSKTYNRRHYALRPGVGLRQGSDNNYACQICRVHIQINNGDSLHSAKFISKYSTEMTNCSSRIIFLVIILSQNRNFVFNLNDESVRRFVYKLRGKTPSRSMEINSCKKWINHRIRS